MSSDVKKDVTLTAAKGNRAGAVVTAICEHCGESFSYRHYGSLDSPKRRYCSQQCRGNREERERRIAENPDAYTRKG